MVGVDYMLDKQEPPSLIKRLVNQRLIPALIDAAAWPEGRLVRATDRIRHAPISSILVMLGLGGSLGFLATRTLRAID